MPRQLNEHDFKRRLPFRGAPMRHMRPHWAAEHAKQLTDPVKIYVLPFGASVAIEHTMQDVEAWAKKKRQERQRGCNLLFLGVDWIRKGGPLAIEAAKILNGRGVPTTLTVVGCQPPVEVPDFVRVLGFISKSTAEGRGRIKELLQESDFLILPSEAEAAGVVFCEASAFGFLPCHSLLAVFQTMFGRG